MKHAIKHVDVFTNVPYTGNPVAVVLNADDLSSEHMQRVANWTNLSETTFVMAASTPEADYRVRIFTPTTELIFAGHPTIGTAHALLEAGLVTAKDGKLMQECGVGLVPVSVTESANEGRIISFDVPNPELRPLSPVQFDELEHILRRDTGAQHPPMFVTAGETFVIVQLDDAAQVLAVSPDLGALRAFSERNGILGLLVFGAHPDASEAAIESRAFFPILGIDEDPVCGSGNGAIAGFIEHTHQLGAFGAEYISSQGYRVGRSGKIRVAIDVGVSIKVGGQSVTCIEGDILL